MRESDPRASRTSRSSTDATCGSRRRGAGHVGRHAVGAHLLRARWRRAGRLPAVEPDAAARGHGPRRHRVVGDLRPVGDGPAHRRRRAAGRGVPLLERLGRRSSTRSNPNRLCVLARMPSRRAGARHRRDRASRRARAPRRGARPGRSARRRAGVGAVLGCRPRRPVCRSATTSSGGSNRAVYDRWALARAGVRHGVTDAARRSDHRDRVLRRTRAAPRRAAGARGGRARLGAVPHRPAWTTSG